MRTGDVSPEPTPLNRGGAVFFSLLAISGVWNAFLQTTDVATALLQVALGIVGLVCVAARMERDKWRSRALSLGWRERS